MLEALVECVIKGHYISLLAMVTVAAYKESLIILLITGGQKRLVVTALFVVFVPPPSGTLTKSIPTPEGSE